MASTAVEKNSNDVVAATLHIELEQWKADEEQRLTLGYDGIKARIAACRETLLSAADAPTRNEYYLWRESTTQHEVSEALLAGSRLPSTPPRKPYNALLSQLGADNWRSHSVMQTPPAQRRDLMDNTPTGSPQSADKMPLDVLLSRIAKANNSPQFNFDSIVEQLNLNDATPQRDGTRGPLFHLDVKEEDDDDGFRVSSSSQGGAFSNTGGKHPASAAAAAVNLHIQQSIPMTSLLSMRGQSETKGLQIEDDPAAVRPKVVAVPGAPMDDPHARNIEVDSKCQVLVEFKRKRVLQFESSSFVGPGEYVVVGGDRGEDVGLVTYTWCETKGGTVEGIGLRGASLTRSIGVGTGTVLRHAMPVEVVQLHSALASLERRAVEVCQQRVIDFALPMVIVDAEYQFDKKKLTFFYESQQRLDFRDLVRDLFKTFRARIWMEAVE